MLHDFHHRHWLLQKISVGLFRFERQAWFFISGTLSFGIESANPPKVGLRENSFLGPVLMGQDFSPANSVAISIGL
jgi:hypothetical protein